MTERSSIRQAGEYLAAEHAARRPLDVMTQDFAPATQEEAYAIQKAFLGIMSESGGAAAGYKIAYTNAVMRERAGIDAPCSGLILSGGVQQSPVTLDGGRYFRLGIECEVAVRLGADLPASGAPYTRESVSDAIEWLAVSFEVIDGREGANPEGVDPALRAIATNINNAGAVLGQPVADWRTTDLSASRGRVTVNGETVDEGLGSAVMGHPVEPLAWLANSLASRGESLSAGEIVLTGSFTPPFMLNAGDTAVVSIEGLGEARLEVE